MDPIERADSLMLQTELSWGKLGGLLGGKPKRSTTAQALGGGQYAIGNNKILQLIGVTEDAFLNYDWDNGKLSFLKKSHWIAKELHLQISHGVENLISFVGEWDQGDFIGNQFVGRFNGSSFQGKFISQFNNYLADPSTFVNGTIASFQAGVLGLAKVDVMSLDKGSQKKSVSLLELQVGHYCNLTDEHGKTHSFQMTKCCDDVSMDIELVEQTGQQRSIRIPWNEMRRNGDPRAFAALSSIRIGGKLQIPYLFANDRVGAISNIEISTKPTLFGTTTDTYRLNTALLRPLTYPSPATTIHLFTPEETLRFGKMFNELSNNAMQMHIANIMDGLKFGIITGWNGYPHLSALFSAKGEPVGHGKYQKSMEWLDEFVQIVVLRMVKSRTSGGMYVKNDVGRKLIMDRLAAMLGAAKPASTTPPPPASGGPSTKKPRPSMIPEQLDKWLAMKQNG